MYDKFMHGTQEEIKDLGSLIENIDLYENITYIKIIRKKYLKVFFLLFLFFSFIKYTN